jgi:hypothetical protein
MRRAFALLLVAACDPSDSAETPQGSFTLAVTPQTTSCDGKLAASATLVIMGSAIMLNGNSVTGAVEPARTPDEGAGNVRFHYGSSGTIIVDGSTVMLHQSVDYELWGDSSHLGGIATSTLTVGTLMRTPCVHDVQSI